MVETCTCEAFGNLRDTILTFVEAQQYRPEKNILPILHIPMTLNKEIRGDKKGLYIW